MQWVKKNLGIFLLLGVAYLIYFFFQSPLSHHQTTSSQHVLAVASPVALFIQPQSGETPLVQAIDSAQKEIDIEMYLLSDKQIITALQQAKSRGVMEHIILEQHPFESVAINPATEKTLTADGIPVKWADSHGALTHEKMLIIDKDTLYILNQNLTAASFKKNREFDIVDTDPTDIAEGMKQFTADWNHTGFTPSDPHLLISPDTSRSGLVQVLQSSTQTLDIYMEVFTDSQLISVIQAKSKTVHVRVILPTLKQVSANASTISTLRAAGADVRTLGSPYIHAKAIVVDDKALYIGSINFTTESMDNNRELGIVVSDPQAVSSVEDTFEKDWNMLY